MRWRNVVGALLLSAGAAAEMKSRRQDNALPQRGLAMTAPIGPTMTA
jgi:hypothetical protein